MSCVKSSASACEAVKTIAVAHRCADDISPPDAPRPAHRPPRSGRSPAAVISCPAPCSPPVLISPSNPPGVAAQRLWHFSYRTRPSLPCFQCVIVCIMEVLLSASIAIRRRSANEDSIFYFFFWLPAPTGADRANPFSSSPSSSSPSPHPTAPAPSQLPSGVLLETCSLCLYASALRSISTIRRVLVRTPPLHDPLLHQPVDDPRRGAQWHVDPLGKVRHHRLSRRASHIRLRISEATAAASHPRSRGFRCIVRSIMASRRPTNLRACCWRGEPFPEVVPARVIASSMHQRLQSPSRNRISSRLNPTSPRRPP